MGKRDQTFQWFQIKWRYKISQLTATLEEIDKNEYINKKPHMKMHHG